MKAILRLVLCVLGSVLGCRAFAAGIDESFRAEGPEPLDYLVALDDGVVAGHGTSIQKFTGSGERDGGFTPSVENGFFVYSLSKDAAGKILVGGEVTRNGNTLGLVYRLMPNGQRDSTFTPVETDARIMAIMELPDSWILIAGFFNHVRGVARPGIARLTPGGALDESFAPREGSLHENLTLAQNGDYFASGLGLRRYAPNGTLLEEDLYANNISFLADDLLTTPAGELWIADAFSSAKILPDQAVDLSYTNSIWITDRGAAVLADGRILVAGTDPARRLSKRFVRLFADGREDPAFSLSTNYEVNVLAMANNGMAYIAGTLKTNSRPFLSRIILDDEAGPTTIQFNRQYASIGEGNVLPMTILRDGGSSGAAMVRFATRAGSASVGVDFIETNGVVTFEPGDEFKTISIPTLGGPEVRTNRSFEVELLDVVAAHKAACPTGERPVVGN